MAWNSLRRQRVVILGVSLGLAVVAFLAVSRPWAEAGAAIGDLTCAAGSGTVNFSPGVSLTTSSQQIHLSGSLGTCTSVSHLDITSGTFAIDGTGSGNCASGGSGSGTGTVSFNDPARSTSTVSVDITIDVLAGVPTMRGSAHVTGGIGAGDMALSIPLTAGFNPADCTSPSGLTSATFAGATTVAT